MQKYQKEYAFNFAKAMKFFLVNIDKSIGEHKIETENIKITLQMRTFNYPYNSDVMKQITKTFDARGIRVIMTSYQTNTEKDAKFKYAYKFTIEAKN